MSSSFVVCSCCNKTFLKDNRYINENKKLGHKFYCSGECLSNFRNKQIEMACENPSCANRFKRKPSHKSFRNFCSTQCAMAIIGPENGSKHKKYRYCTYCGNAVIGNNKYCSPKCWVLDHRISKQYLINELQNLANKLGRSPTKRECNFHTSCIRQFSSWNNALIAADLTPHRSLNQKMYKRRKCIAKDGHACNSVSELIIDNWLTEHRIQHTKEAPYPEGKFTADWKISSTLVEYFGLAKDSRRYDQEIKKKQQICKNYGVNLIEIYSKDLFPKSKLEHIFKIQRIANFVYSPNHN